MVTVTGRSAAASTPSTNAAASSTEAFALRRLNDSVAASVQFTRSSAVARSRSNPRSLSTRPDNSVPSGDPAAATTSSAPAICGTRSSRTNETASTRGSPAAASRETSSARTAGASTSGSFWSPSRGPTSQIVTPTRRAYPSGMALLALVAAALVVGAPADEWSRLRAHPLRLPTLPAGFPCPVSRVDQRVDFHRYGIGDGIGSGPAYPIGLADGVLELVWNTTEFRGRWGGQKVLWWAHPRYRGPVLIRGGRLDAPGRVRFERGALPPLELRIPRRADPLARGRGRPSYTRLRVPGCYAYQIDGLGFSRRIVFRAVAGPG
jgi:hypothetical protein